MLKRRLNRLEGKQSDKPLHFWWIAWREMRDPFAARDELHDRQKAGALSPNDDAELARLNAAIPNYELDLAI